MDVRCGGIYEIAPRLGYLIDSLACLTFNRKVSESANTHMLHIDKCGDSVSCFLRLFTDCQSMWRQRQRVLPLLFQLWPCGHSSAVFIPLSEHGSLEAWSQRRGHISNCVSVCVCFCVCVCVCVSE